MSANLHKFSSCPTIRHSPAPTGESPSPCAKRPFLCTDSPFPRHLSSKLALFEDGHQFFHHLSSKPPYFEDGCRFFCRPSSEQTFFEDSQSPPKAFSAGIGRAAAVQAKKSLPVATLPLYRLRSPASADPHAAPAHPPDSTGKRPQPLTRLPHRLTQNGSGSTVHEAWVYINRQILPSDLTNVSG